MQSDDLVLFRAETFLPDLWSSSWNWVFSGFNIVDWINVVQFRDFFYYFFAAVSWSEWTNVVVSNLVAVFSSWNLNTFFKIEIGILIIPNHRWWNWIRKAWYVYYWSNKAKLILFWNELKNNFDDFKSKFTILEADLIISRNVNSTV